MMANTIKSALFVDYDSFHRSLNAANPDVATQFAEKSAAWIAAIGDGRLISPPPEDGERRRLLIRRCYADPRLLGDQRAALIAAGVEVVDCPAIEGRERNSAEVHMVLDMVDALEHPADYDEFILLSADADLTPALLRLRAHDRTSVIFGGAKTAASYTSVADATIDEAPMLKVLAGEELSPPTPAKSAAAPVVPAGDRGAVETLARKIHTATNVPMFSPRTFADMFRMLAQEIAEHGYHFQKTAENVTQRLTEAGRNANRRQVLFVVKGLALKGHVFSTSDTPEQLAEVFRDQVLYLAESAGLKLSDEEKELLPAWIVGRSQTPPVRPAATPARIDDEPPVKKTATRRRPLRPRRTRTEEATVEAKPADEKEKAPAEEPEEQASDEKAAATPPPTAKKSRKARKKAKAAAPAEEPDDDAEEEIDAEEQAPEPKEESSTLRRFAEIKANTASRLAALTKSSSAGGKAAAAASTKSKPAPAKPAPSNGGAAAKGSADQPKSAALESSILAAIAEAVDVLVEDSDNPKKKGDEASIDEAAALLEAEAAEEPTDEPDIASEPAPEPEPSDGGDSDDIGDEIQRIIASYSRARQGD